MSNITKTEARRLCERIRQQAADLAESIRQLRDGEGWRVLGYETWAACCEAEFGYSKQHANRLIKADLVRQQVEPMGSTSHPAAPQPNERQARELGRLPEADRGQAWRQYSEQCDREEVRPTAAGLRAAVDQRLEADTPAGSDRWRQIRVDEEFCHVARRTLTALAEAGLETLGVLRDRMQADPAGWWNDVPNIGKAAAAELAEAWIVFWDELADRQQADQEPSYDEDALDDDAPEPPHQATAPRRSTPADPVWDGIEDAIRGWIGDDTTRRALAAAKLENLAEAIRRE